MPQIDAFERDLRRLGLDPAKPELLAVLPLVYVAWADGKMEYIERERILAIAQVELRLDGQAMAVVTRWLNRPPTNAYYQLGLRLLRELSRAPDAMELGTEDLQRSIAQAESVARSAPEAPDNPWVPHPVEEQALERVAVALDIDMGQCWSRLLRDLGEAAGPMAGPAPC